MTHFTCSLCATRKFATLKSYLLHLRIRHANDCNFRVKCGLSNCLNEYNKYASLYRHICRNHSDFLATTSCNDQYTQQAVKVMYSDDDDNDDDEQDIHPMSVDVSKLREKLKDMRDMASVPIHCTFGESKKKLDSPISELKANLEALFKIAGVDYILQTWDEDDKDWVDVDDVISLEGQARCKLNIVLR